MIARDYTSRFRLTALLSDDFSTQTLRRLAGNVRCPIHETTFYSVDRIPGCNCLIGLVESELNGN